MPINWINDDGTFVEGFEKNLPEETRDYVKGYKDLHSLIKAGLEAKREFRDRVKLPKDPAERAAFLKEHFSDVLDSQEKARKEAAETEALSAEQKRKNDQAKDAEVKLNAAKGQVQELLTVGGAKAETSIELCRRAFRSKHCPQWIKEGIAAAAGVEIDKVSDDQFKELLLADPAVAQTLLTLGNLTKDGRMESGDGHEEPKENERYPAYPHTPEAYGGEPDDNLEKRWFINRGAVYEGGHYLGGFGMAKP